MVDFSIEVDRIRLKLTYDPIPTLDPGSLGVLVSKQAADYGPVTSTAPHYTSLIPGAPYLTGAQLGTGLNWLVFYSGSMGAGDDETVARAWVIDSVSTGTPRYFAIGGAEGPYVAGSAPTLPLAARNTGCCGSFYYTSNGTHLEFSFENKTGVSVLAGSSTYFHDFTIIAVPVDTIPATYIGYASIPPDHSDLTFTGGLPYCNLPPPIVPFVSPQNALTLTTFAPNFTIPATDDYLVLGSCMGKESGVQGAQIEYRLIQDTSISLGTDWKKETEDTNDFIPVNAMYVKTYTNGQVVNLALQGKPNESGISRFEYLPRTLVLRMGAFARRQYITTPTTPVPVTAVAYQGAWQVVCERSFTPLSETGEYVLIIARMMAWRTNFGAMLGRLVIKETGEIIKDFVPNSNVNGIDYDRSDIFLCAAKLENSPRTYQLQVVQPDGVPGTAFVGQSTLVAIGCTKSAVPGSIYNESINDLANGNGSGVGVSDATGVGGSGVTTYGEPINDLVSQNSASVADGVVVPVSPSSPPLVRPRLWFYNNGRLAYLRTRTGGAEYARMIATMGQESLPQNFKYILKWKVTQNAADLTAAKDRYFGPTGLFTQNIVELLWGSDHSDSGFMYRFIMRDLALALDWFYDDNGVDQLTTLQRDTIRNAILALTYAKCQTRSAAVAMDSVLDEVGTAGNKSYLDWANADTHNNHFYFMMLGAAYAGISLYGEQPTTFKYKSSTVDAQGNATQTFAANTWLSGQTFQFQIPYHIYGGQVSYTTIWNWVRDRVDFMMLPVLDVDMAGGFTEEGTNYGLSSAAYMTEMFNIINGTVGLNYVQTHPVFSDHGYYQIYSTQPGATNNVNLGDQPNSPIGRALVNDRNRLLALMVGDAMPSQTVAGYLQYFVNHKVTTMTEKNFDALDFLLYRHDRAETDIAGLPLLYVASGTGFVNSRDTWADTAVSVSMSACEHGEEHHHSDLGALQIYHGDAVPPVDAGWMTIDINMLSTIGNNWDLNAHSTHTVCTSANPTGWPQQFFGTPPVVPPPPITAPDPPVLSSPSDGAIGIVVPTTFTWLASVNAITYTLQVSTSLSFNSYTLATTTGLSTSVSGLAGNTVHYWRVNATNSGGTGAYSPTYSFTTESGITPPPPSGVKLVEDTTALQIFPTNNWWNKDVSAWPLDAQSTAIINYLMTLSSSGFPAGSFHPDCGTVSSTYGIPYIGVDGTQPLLPVTFNGGSGYTDNSDLGQPGRPNGYPIPAQAHASSGSGTTPGYREENGDNHMLVFDRDNMYLYEMYKAAWSGSAWSASIGACFQMNTNNRRPTGWNSSEAAGMAVFPGLMKYDDLHGAGQITHATRFSVKQSNGQYVYPANHVSANDSPPVPLPMGLRIRMKASKDITGYPAEIRKLFQAWKTYGLILADRGGNGFVQGTMDNRWVNGQYNSIFHALRFTDFEVIQLGYDAVSPVFHDTFDDVTSLSQIFAENRWASTQEELGGVVTLSQDHSTSAPNCIKCVVPGTPAGSKKADIVRYWIAVTEGQSIWVSWKLWLTGWSPSSGNVITLFDIEDPDQSGAPCGQPTVFTSPGRNVYLSSGSLFRSILNKWCYNDQINQVDATVFPQGQWVDMRFYMLAKSDATGKIKVWRDGTIALNGSSIRTLPDAASTYTRMQVGATASDAASGATVYIDDVRVFDQDPGWV